MGSGRSGTHIVILGGSFAGLEAARTARHLLGRRARITLIDKSDTFVFRPSLPWVAFGQRRPQDIRVPLAPLLASDGIEFVHDHVVAVEPDRNTVYLRQGNCSYDFLIIALGATSPPKAHPEAPAGWEGRFHVPIWLTEAVQLRQAVKRFRGGHVVVALHPRSPLTCPAYELVFQAAAFWRRKGLGDRCRLTFITYEDDLYAVGGTRATRAARQWMKEAGIRPLTNTFIQQVTPRSVVLGDGYELPADILMVLPAYQGSDFLRRVPYLTDAEGFVLTDQAMRSQAYVNIFAAGDCVALPGPKTGLMAEQQGRIAAVNIAADLGLTEPARYRSLLACLVDLGPGRGLLSVRRPAPQLGRVQTLLFLAGSLPRWGKYSLERYFLGYRLRAPLLAGAASHGWRP